MNQLLSDLINEGIKPDYVIVQRSGPSRIARQDVFEKMIFKLNKSFFLSITSDVFIPISIDLTVLAK